MLKLLPIVYYIYSAALIGGGAMGSRVSGKPSSLIGGAVFGVIAATAGGLAGSNPRVGLLIGIADAIAVTVFFIYRYLSTHKAMPAFPSIAMSLIVIVLTGIALSKLAKS